MKVSQLIEKVGVDHVKCQFTHECLVNVSLLKKEGRITFATELDNARGVMKQLASPSTGMVACIVWMPTEKLLAALKQGAEEEEAREGQKGG